VPAYNGGPFISRPRAGDESAEAAAAHFFAQHTVPDAFLAPAIDLLARDDDPKTHELVSIDFSRWACVNSVRFMRACSNSDS
jgi:hypothetical protein